MTGKCLLCGYPQIGTWPRLLVDFWRKVKRGDGCWLWQGAKTADGYGSITFRGERQYAHRLSWVIYGNVLSPDKEICHTCDNPPCIRPEHLFQDIHKVNMRDMIQKKGPPGAKVTEAQVLEIRERFTKGERIDNLSKEYSVSLQIIERIIRRDTWDLTLS